MTYMSVNSSGFQLGMQGSITTHEALGIIMKLREIGLSLAYSLRGFGITLSRNILKPRSNMCSWRVKDRSLDPSSIYIQAEVV